MGFKQPLEVSTLVRGWLADNHPLAQGQCRSPATCRAGADPDSAFRSLVESERGRARLRSVSCALQAAGRLLSLLRQNPDLISLFALCSNSAAARPTAWRIFPMSWTR